MTVYDGTSIFRSGTFANVPVSISPYTSDRTEKTWQAAGGAIWQRDGVKVNADVAYPARLV